MSGWSVSRTTVLASKRYDGSALLTATTSMPNVCFGQFKSFLAGTE